MVLERSVWRWFEVVAVSESESDDGGERGCGRVGGDVILGSSE